MPQHDTQNSLPVNAHDTLRDRVDAGNGSSSNSATLTSEIATRWMNVGPPQPSISTYLPPPPPQGIAQLKSSHWSPMPGPSDWPQPPNHPQLGYGNSGIVPLYNHLNTYRHNTDNSMYSPVAPQLLHTVHRENLAHSETHKVHNATFGEGSFAHAHNIRIDTAYMIEYNQTGNDRGAEEARKYLGMIQAENEKLIQETKILDKLLSKAMPSAMLESEDRGYIPSCDERTRRTIRKRIVRWAQDNTLSHSLFWLSGPAAVGKSVVAQTVAETMTEKGLLGATFFFSRPNGRCNPSAVIPTLAVQLFTNIPEYRRIVSDEITRDPTILQKNREIQFQKLIIDPFVILANSQAASDEQGSLLIVLDGLDECSDRVAQSEFVTIISRHAQSAPRLRFLICSRPEPHLEVAFSKSGTQAITIQERLNVDDIEARRDANRLLRKGFTEIRSRYPDQLTDDWPTRAQTRLIADHASGHLGFVSFILRFIGDENYDDPFCQLEVCIRFLEHSGGPETSNPLYDLDLLYTQIFSDIPASILPTTQRILALFIVSKDMVIEPSLCAQANFLKLSQASTYSALRRLHSVIAIPGSTRAPYSNLQVHHSSFTDYLMDPARSGKYALDKDTLPPLFILTQSIQWLDCIREFPEAKAPRLLFQDDPNQQLPRLAWKPLLPSSGHTIWEIIMFSLSSLWWACPRIPEESLEDSMDLLERFDFNLDYSWWILNHALRSNFSHFIRWLFTLGPLSASLIKVVHPDDLTTETPDITIEHPVDDLDAFAAPFPHLTETEMLIVHIKLGRVNPILLKLSVWSFN
ncbi:hypothetical protein NP233_g7734 [Leucocoprinus birnbaumii]|uniref:Nephrocystin 3-like N-terminal domain-containing protein n=1 Tax=Leucocoprinus birnbaumii TaxID=56174 RepID=A0AAD5YPP2_9AGAR|nr:hypothetical protein NP233_g7734 [Leucocoprinus birnbaumii]